MAAAWKPSLVFEGSLPPPANTRGPRRSSKVKTPPLVQVKVIRPLSNREEHWVSPQFDSNMQKDSQKEAMRQKKKKSHTLTARTVLFDPPPSREITTTSNTNKKVLIPLNFTSTKAANVQQHDAPIVGVVTPPTTPLQEAVVGFNPMTYSTPTTSVSCTSNVPSLNAPCTSVPSNVPCTSTCVPCTPSISTSSDSILAMDTPIHLYGRSIFDRNEVT